MLGRTDSAKLGTPARLHVCLRSRHDRRTRRLQLPGPAHRARSTASARVVLADSPDARADDGRWRWLMVGTCACGLLGFGLAAWLAFTGRQLLTQFLAVQAVFLASLGVLVWRLRVAYHLQLLISKRGSVDKSQLQVTLATTAKELQASKASGERLQQQLASLRNQKDTAQEDLRRLRAQYDKLQARADKKALLSESRVVAALQAKLKEARKGFSQLRAKANAPTPPADAPTTAASANPGPPLAVADADAAPAAVEASVPDAGEAAATAARGERASEAFESALTQLQSTITSAAAHGAEDAAELRRVELARIQSEAEASRLRAELDAAKQEVVSRGQEIARMQARVESAERGEAERAEEVAAAKAALEELRSSQADAVATASTLQAEVGALQAALAERQRQALDLEAAAEAAAAGEKELREALARAEREAAQAKAGVQKLEELQRGQAAVAQDNARLQERVREYTARLEAAEGASSRMGKLIQDLHAKNSDAMEGMRAKEAALREALRAESSVKAEMKSMSCAMAMLTTVVQQSMETARASDSSAKHATAALQQHQEGLARLQGALGMNIGSAGSGRVPAELLAPANAAVVESLVHKVQQLRIDRDTTRSAQVALQGQVDRLQAEAEEQRQAGVKKLRESRKQRDILCAKLRNALGLSRAQSRAVGEASDSEELLEVTVQDAINALRAQQAALGAAQDRADELAAEVEALRSEQATAKSAAQAGEEANATLAQKELELSAMSVDFEAVREETGALRAQLKAQGEEHAAALEAVRHTLGEAQEETSKERARADGISAELAASKETYSLLETTVGKLRAALARTDCEAAELREAADSRADREAEAARRALQHAEAEAMLQLQVNQVTRERDEQKAQAEQLQAGLERAEAALEQERNMAERRQQDLQSSHEAQAARVEQLEATLQKQDTECARLQALVVASKASEAAMQEQEEVLAAAREAAEMWEERAQGLCKECEALKTAAAGMVAAEELQEAQNALQAVEGRVVQLVQESQAREAETEETLGQVQSEHQAALLKAAAATKSLRLENRELRNNLEEQAGEVGELRAAAEEAASRGAVTASQLEQAEQLMGTLLKQLDSSSISDTVLQTLQQQGEQLEGKEATIDDLNVLLERRNLESKRLRDQLESVRQQPKEGMTLKQLAAKAALADALHTQNTELSQENEKLRRKHPNEQRGPNGPQMNSNSNGNGSTCSHNGRGASGSSEGNGCGTAADGSVAQDSNIEALAASLAALQEQYNVVTSHLRDQAAPEAVEGLIKQQGLEVSDGVLVDRQG